MSKRGPKKIIRLPILEDDNGRYIGMCNYRGHPGAIRASYQPTCVSRNCRHYERVYLDPQQNQLQDGRELRGGEAPKVVRI